MSVGETTLDAPASAAWMPRRLLADNRLARLAARGDQRAFEAIFERYHQELYRYCRAILRDSDDAQDALQATMASALHSLPGEERRIVLRPWLYRVAHNEAISILRKRSEAPDSPGAPEPTTAGADMEAEARERLRSLVADLDRLPDRQRGALVMRELSGLSYAEIGAALTVSSAGARQAVYEARMALRDVSRGREMDCDAARRAVSEGDGRRLRNRRLRAHLHACDSCSDFSAAISQRRSDLQALCPPLPAIAASGLMAGVLGGTGNGGLSAAAGGVAGGAGVAAGGATGGMVVKGASLAAAIAIGAGAAGMSGVARMPVLDRDGPPVKQASQAPTQSVDHAGAGAGEVGASHARATSNGRASVDLSDAARRTTARAGQASAAGGAGAVGRSDPAQGNGLPATSSGTAPPHSSAGGNSTGNGHPAEGTPGKSAAAPGHGGSSRGNSDSAPGHSGSKPGNSGSAPGHSSSPTPGNSGSAPGHSSVRSPGNSGSAPAHSSVRSPGNSAASPGLGGAGNGRGSATAHAGHSG